MFVILVFDIDVVEAGYCAMLDGHDDLLVKAAQLERPVAASVSSLFPCSACPGVVAPLFVA